MSCFTCSYTFQSSLKRPVHPIPMYRYHTHKRLCDELDYLTREFSDIAVKYSIGSSVKGRDIVCIKITEDANIQTKLLKPQVKFIANIHGDECVGRELLLGLARWVFNYQLYLLYSLLLKFTEIFQNLSHIPLLQISG